MTTMLSAVNDRQSSQFRDDGARALRTVFSSRDNWPNMSEAERDEWRGYFNGMLEQLRDLGYSADRSPRTMLLERRVSRHRWTDRRKRSPGFLARRSVRRHIRP
jgi:hypothetical protein